MPPNALLSELEQLAKKFKGYAYISDKDMEPNRAIAYRGCADELEALIKRIKETHNE